MVIPPGVGLLHLVGNGLVLYLYGPYVELTVGRYGFLALYLLAGVFGGAWSVAVAPTGLKGNCGASQATFAIFGGLVGSGLALSVMTGDFAALSRPVLILGMAMFAMLPLTLVAGFAAGRGFAPGATIWGLIGHSPGVLVGFALAFGLTRWHSVWPNVGAAALVLASSALMLVKRWAPWRLFAAREAISYTPWLERRSQA